MELKILGSICFLEAVGTVGNIMDIIWEQESAWQEQVC